MVLGFAFIILLGTFLLMLPVSTKSNQRISFLDALFTATSSVCVTGLIVVDTGSYWSSFGQTIILSLIQVGGLGFVLVGASFAIFSRKKINLKERILIQESLNQYNLSDIISLAKNVLKITLFIECIGAIILSFVFIPQLGLKKGIFYSIFHSVSAFCNAGFDIMGSVSGEFTSLTSYVVNPLVVLTVSSLIILGGLGFPVILDILKIKEKPIKRLSTHSKLAIYTTVISIFIGCSTIFIVEFNNIDTLKELSFNGKLLASLFQSVTTRTAGFNTLDLSLMNEGVIFLLIMLMFIGASPASTGGGIKTTTIATTALSVKAFVLGREDVEIFEKRISTQTMRKAIGLTFISFTVAIIGTIIIAIIEPNFNLLEAGFEVASALTTAGLSLVGSSQLTSFGKALIIIYMFIGRIGSLTIFMALISKKNLRHNNVRYPESKILIG